jgi:hypothetical protein
MHYKFFNITKVRIIIAVRAQYFIHTEFPAASLANAVHIQPRPHKEQRDALHNRDLAKDDRSEPNKSDGVHNIFFNYMDRGADDFVFSILL